MRLDINEVNLAYKDKITFLRPLHRTGIVIASGKES